MSCRGRVQALEVEACHARFVTRRCHDLTRGEAAYVDARVVESADGRIAWTQFETLLEASITAANPGAARAREAAARVRRFATATGSTSDGMRGFYLRTDAAGITRLDATGAGRWRWCCWPTPPTPPGSWPGTPPGNNTPPPRTGRAPWGLGLGKRDSTDVARLEGIGPLTEARARPTLGDKASFVIRPVIDLAGMAPMQSYLVDNTGTRRLTTPLRLDLVDHDPPTHRRVYPADLGQPVRRSEQGAMRGRRKHRLLQRPAHAAPGRR